MKASGKLVKGEVYTRRQLKELFDISNQTISKSIFQPAGHESVFVFVNFSDSPTEPERDTALADPVVATLLGVSLGFVLSLARSPTALPVPASPPLPVPAARAPAYVA